MSCTFCLLVGTFYNDLCSARGSDAAVARILRPMAADGCWIFRRTPQVNARVLPHPKLVYQKVVDPGPSGAWNLSQARIHDTELTAFIASGTWRVIGLPVAAVPNFRVRQVHFRFLAVVEDYRGKASGRGFF